MVLLGVCNIVVERIQRTCF